jgi:hypothetical protein
MNLLSTSLLLLPLVILPATLAGCDSDAKVAADGGPDDDLDQDGFTPNTGDCNDDNRSIYPGAPDPCDGVDQNCDGTADELFDQDNDNYTTCAGDCRDNDPASNPGASEVVDGFDNDCDGIPDNHTDQYDDDGDGYSEDQGDCNDDENGGGALIGPDAVEVALNSEGEVEGVDNDCDGIIDEAIEPCPTDLPATDAMAYANAMDVCHEVISAGRAALVDDRSQGIYATFGNTYVPFTGPDFAALSTGFAGDASDAAYDDHSTSLDNQIAHPDPQPLVGTCGGADEANVNDYSEVSLAIQVPSNAQAFSFDFNFMSIEFPEFVCTSFDDTFLAMLESDAFTGNVSFDSMGSRVSINVGFFDVCSPSLDPSCTGEADLIGTGFEEGDAGGGGTGWLTTTAPVVPGEKIRLTFMIFDEGDHILDSTVLIDNFRWELEPVDGPVTVDRVHKPTKGARLLDPVGAKK